MTLATILYLMTVVLVIAVLIVLRTGATDGLKHLAILVGALGGLATAVATALAATAHGS